MTTTKVTMIDGNWRRIEVELTRKGNGWVETPKPAVERKAS